MINKNHVFFTVCLQFLLFASCQSDYESKSIDTVFVDSGGVMRWESDSTEASFFGVNYTLPFAHGYRAAKYDGIDIKAAIDNDVYHMARLGFNAYRIHIWDVEISDDNGHVINNEHLDLLDYLIYRLQERGIYTLVTAQTNLGNGYPERNIDTGGFAYKYDKCEIHSNPQAIKEQQTYLSELVDHQNKYTGNKYSEDPYIIGLEINNEPCHSTTKEQTEEYISTMVKTVKRAGFNKAIFYNVSHNQHLAEAYFDSDIDGTTYQWYPIGLVKGEIQKGNFLPAVDNYNIPYEKIPGFETKAKAIYEFDPADIMYSYMIPAMVRSFRKAGFQWITHFAYDALCIGGANTEYQTHYLNLAYTPSKAISMKISKEISKDVNRYEDFGSYPNDTVFGDFRVSYKQDLSELNSEEKFYYSNSTQSYPKSESQLKSIAGVGNSPVVNYEGSGAYFIDKIEDGIWRLEIMPDILVTHDPFGKPALNRRVVEVIWNKRDMTLKIDNLGDTFKVRGINSSNNYCEDSKSGIINGIGPGVYLLTTATKDIDDNTQWGNIKLNEYAAPKQSVDLHKAYISHQPTLVTEQGEDLKISAEIISGSSIDSVFIYTEKVSFWNNDNKLYKLTSKDHLHYETVIDSEDLPTGSFRYNIVVFGEGYNYCFPQSINKTPLDWDYLDYQYYETTIVDSSSLVSLYSATKNGLDIDAYSSPTWSKVDLKVSSSIQAIGDQPSMSANFNSQAEDNTYYLRRYVKDEILGRLPSLPSANYIVVELATCPEDLEVSLIDEDGFCYSVKAKQYYNGAICRVPIKSLQQSKLPLIPVGYPVFVDKQFISTTEGKFNIRKVESVQLSFSSEKEINLSSIYIQ